METFEAALVLGKHTGSVKDLINLTQNLDLYRFYPDISDDEGLGHLYADELGTIDIPEHIQGYFDYEAYGDGICVSTRAAYSLPAAMWRRTRWALRSITTGRRTYRRNTGYLPIPKRPSPSIPFSAHSNGFKRPRPFRKRTRRGLPMRNGKTSGQWPEA